MKSRLFWMYMVILLVIPKPITAQVDGWATGCDSEAQPVIAITTQLDYEAACETYTTCSEADSSIGLCQMRAFMTLREGCSEALCETEAALYAANITVFNNLYNFDIWNEGKGSETLQMTIPAALAAFQAGDYEAAADLWQGIDPAVYTHPMLHLSAGLAYAAGGDSETALAAYDQAIAASYHEPLSYYVRGKALAATGEHTHETAIDFSLFAQYTVDDPSLTALGAPFVETFPMPTNLFESWIAYPVLASGDSPGGSWMIDQTLEAARTVKMGKLNTGDKLAAQNLSQLLDSTYYNLPSTLVLSSTGDQLYSFGITFNDDYGAWGGDLTLNMNTSPIQVDESNMQFESYRSTTFILAPEGEADPRLSFEGERCPGAALSRLKIGEDGWAMGVPGEPLMLLDAIGGAPISRIETFTVIDGPTCQENAAWWQITLADGTTGWAAESDGSEYRLRTENLFAVPAFRTGT